MSKCIDNLPICGCACLRISVGVVALLCEHGRSKILHVLQARVTVVDWLKEKGLFRGTAGNAMRLGLCSRSGDVIEPVLKPQWYA